MWFAVDDSGTSVRVPIYASVYRAPSTWGQREGDDTFTGDILKFNFDSAFWVFNMVANLAYNRWSDVYPEIVEKIKYYESSYF